MDFPIEDLLSETAEAALVATVQEFWADCLRREIPTKWAASGYDSEAVLHRFYDALDREVCAANWKRHEDVHDGEMEEFRVHVRRQRARRKPRGRASQG